MAKTRKQPPKCEGRFGELRGLCYEISKELRDAKKDPLWAIVTKDDLNEFTNFGWGGGIEPLALYDAKDPYFGNKRDILRGDPLVGDIDNFTLALIPAIFEAMRGTLYKSKQEAIGLLRAIQDPEEDKELLAIRTEDLTHVPAENVERLAREGILQEDYLNPIAQRDFTITANSVDPSLLLDYARLYITNPRTLDKIRLFHRGVHSLDKELGVDMARVLVPTINNHGKKSSHVNTSGYFMKAEFGTGLNTEMSLVGDAPYRIDVYKRDNSPKGLILGNPTGEPVFGMSFYIKHPDVMVLSQIQDIRGARVPEGTTDGLCGLTLAEKIGSALGFREIVTYSHYTNPVRFHYPGDAQLATILNINFDQAAKILGWECIRKEKTEQREGFRKILS